jgi:transcriptional regulator with XRE-family HTH domain
MDLYDRIKLLVREQGITIEGMLELAMPGKASIDTYNGWRRRGVIPRGDVCLKIARTLGVSVEYLLTGETPSTYTPRTTQVKAIFDGILHATQAELDIIYRIIVKEEQAETQRIKNA